MNIVINNTSGSEVDVSEDDNGNTVVNIRDKEADSTVSRYPVYVGSPVEFKCMVVGSGIKCLVEDIEDPNSEISKSLQRSFEINRRR